jgi:hypothetical protein
MPIQALMLTVLLTAESEGIASADSTPGARMPSAQTITRLRDLSRHRYLVVWCRDGRFELTKPHFDETGIWSRDRNVYRAPRQAVLQSADAVRMKLPPKPIPWETVDSVAVGTRAPGPVVAIAAIGSIGFALGLSVAGLILASTHSLGASTGTVLGVGIPVVVAGSLVAASVVAREHRTVVYRASVEP